MSKALIESSFFRASYAERLDCRGARAPKKKQTVKPLILLSSVFNSDPTDNRPRFIHAGRPKDGAKLAMTARGFSLSSPRHCERSAAIQQATKEDWIASSQGLLKRNRWLKH